MKNSEDYIREAMEHYPSTKDYANTINNIREGLTFAPQGCSNFSISTDPSRNGSTTTIIFENITPDAQEKLLACLQDITGLRLIKT